MRTVVRTVLLFVAFAAAASGDLTSRSAAASQMQAAAPCETTRDARDFAGDDACRTCHREQVETYHRTAHFLTSRLPDGDSILGKFAPGNNILKTANPALFFRMEEHKPDEKGKSSAGQQAGFFQTAVEGTPAHTTSHAERFALVVGSGGKGQTYLFWKGDQLFQLPISYWTNLGWVNSPGYRDGFVNFDRPIIPRCLECHATYFEALPPPTNRYATAGFTLGIQCEKCHGPGREHIARETSQEKPKATPAAAAAILNPARFSRDRQMDLCAWCHAGHGQPLLPSFSYVPGDSLERFIDLPRPDPAAALDVHGSQVEMLKRSRCYAGSTMTCLTCHDVHATQHDLAEFSRRCLECHKPDSSAFSKPDHYVSANCIDCHMPKQETGLIVFEWSGKRVSPRVRNHWIKVYSDIDAPQESR